jgi:alpha-tubulin suppressor-like RCC1 family protein
LVNINDVKTIGSGSWIDDVTTFLKNDGTVWGGGRNTNGQLGIPATGGGTQVGMAQAPGITNGKRIYCKDDASCLLRTDGSISFSGINTGGVFGYQASTAAATPLIYSFVTPNGGMQGTVVDVLMLENSTLALTVN